MGKKLIEVALPLDIINDASAYDKMPGIGAHPKGIHHWWARLPLPAARAILFASLVNDPSAHPDKFPTEEAQVAERERLFEIIRKLCQKKIHTKQEVFEEAHQEILKHCNGKLPTLLDPFAGGGSIPLEGMRLGLPVQASDLNPVAVLINKAQLEILPEFANQVPINPSVKGIEAFTEWKLGKGLAEDLRYYGNWINEEAKKRIGKYYPKVKIGNKEHNIITWLWARTVKCPNPACGCEMPLVRSFILSSKKKPNFYSRPIIERTPNGNKTTGYEDCKEHQKLKGL
jgi:putative DNA methylase